MEWYEAAFDSLYPVIYDHRDIEEAAAVIESFGDFFAGREPVLDLACGSGRYLECLSKRGYQVYGLDLSHYLLRMCMDSWGHAGKVVQADMRRLPFLGESMGAVINMFTSFGYFSRDTDNLLVFKEIFRILKRGGVFLFDFINARRIASSLLEESQRISGGYRIIEKRRIEGYGKYLVKDIQVTNLQSGQKANLEERLRLYAREELLIMFESVGLKVIDIFGDYDRNPFLEGVSERVIAVSLKE